MELRLLLYLCILLLGGILGYKRYNDVKLKSTLNIMQSISLLFLLFIMGVRIGLDKNVIKSFMDLGLQGTILAVFSIVFSILLVKIARYLVFTKRKEKEVI